MQWMEEMAPPNAPSARVITEFLGTLGGATFAPSTIGRLIQLRTTYVKMSYNPRFSNFGVWQLLLAETTACTLITA